MARCVTVTVPARLHLGFLDIDGTLGRRFGSLGVAVERPVTRLTLRRAPRTVVEGGDDARAARHLAAMRERLGVSVGHHLEVEAVPPAHTGLGSGTQMALGVAAALRRLHGLELDVRGDAAYLGRGRRSGVGIGLFEQGGLVLDGGRGPEGAPAPILARLAFPEEWRILLVHDTSSMGMHGEAEVRAFAELPPFPESAAAHLCHLVVMRALPGLVERDAEGFGAAITEIQDVVGDWFAGAQGGRYTSPKVARALSHLREGGAHGVGQSSWGPTGFAFAASAKEARALMSSLDSTARLDGVTVEAVRASNHGASVTVREAATIA